MDYNKKALEMHKKFKGKIEIKSKVPLNNRDDLSVAYTPGVAEPCREIAKDKEKVYDYTIKGNCVAVISDGSAVLGLGNIGPEAGLPVMEGKAVLFKEFAGIDAFPICLDVHKPEEIIRVVKAIAPVFGGINLEDIKAPECFEVESGLQDLGIPVMHDDQHGTAIVVLAALTNALKVAKLQKDKVNIVVNGAGAAGIAITRLLLSYGFRNITLVDSKGAVHKKRKDLDGEKLKVAQLTNLNCVDGSLEVALKGADVFIGVSKSGLLKKEMIKKMNSKPIIFAMANPIPEIMPDEARAAGAFIVATGRSDFPNQINNVLAFPGVFRGALNVRATKITEKMKIGAAEALMSLVEKPSEENILPKALDKSVVPAVASAVQKAWLSGK